MQTIALVTALLIAGASPMAQAVTVRVDFSGIVDSIGDSGDVGDPVAAIGGSVVPGTAFSGHFTFDDSVAPFHVSDSGSEHGITPGAGEFVSEVGAFTTDASWVDPGDPLLGIFSIFLYDAAAGPDPSSVGAAATLSPPPTGDLQLYIIELELDGDLPGEPLDSLSLADVPWSLAAFPNARVNWYFQNDVGSYVDVWGTIDSLSVTVPEPSAGALGAAMLAGLIALGFRRARG
ncbi:MAG: hypothetical protein FJ108_04255 [Deltaproteobacteria bacterium]|nr:hypothetical protein [Deltaproteobacteria bacterium]